MRDICEFLLELGWLFIVLGFMSGAAAVFYAAWKERRCS